MNKQPLLILVICFILGIFFQDYFLLNKNYVVAVVIFCLIMAAGFFFKHYWLFKIRNFFLAALFFGLGISFHFFSSPDRQSISFNSSEIIVFKISKKLNSNQKYKKYEGWVKTGDKSFSSIISIPYQSGELDFRHYYKAKAYIAQPKSPEHDFQFDYSRYLSRKNIYHQSFINGKISSVLRKDLSFKEKVRQKRLEILQKINKSEMSVKSREFLKGIILADRTEIDQVTVNDFNRSGLVHILAISGTHIAVIFGLFYFLMMKFFPVRLKKHAIVLSLFLIWVFALFVGLGNSVLRSCIMITVYFIFVLLQRKPDLLHAVALSAFIILMIDTQQIFDVGFQLSFLAVLGIFWLNQAILEYLPRRNNWVKKIFYNTISISIAAQLATLPLVLHYFHQFSLISVLANFIIVPFSELIIVFSFFMTVLMAMSLDFGLVNFIYDFIIRFLLGTIHWFADFDALFFTNIPMNLFEVFAFFGIIYFLKFALNRFNFRNISNLMVSIAIFFGVKVSSDIFENYKDEQLVHHYKKEAVISLKKGNKAVFWLNDSAEKDKIQQYIIDPYISSRRIKNVEIKSFPASAKAVKIEGEIYQLKQIK